MFPASLQEVEQDFQAPLAHGKHRLLGLFLCVCVKHHTNDVAVISVK